MQFGNNIKLLRKRKRISQEDLSSELGIKRTSLSGYELGNSEPNFETLLRFSAFFKISIDKSKLLQALRKLLTFYSTFF